MLRKRKGSALVTIFIFVVVLALLGVALLNLSVSDNDFSIFQAKNTKAYYVARSGAAAVANYIQHHPGLTTAMNGQTYDATSGIGALDGTMSVAVLRSGDGDVTLTSTGTLTSGMTDTIRLRLNYMEPSDIFRYAIFTDQDLDISGMDWIDGPVGSNGSITSDAGVDRLTGTQDDVEYANMVFEEDPYPTDLGDQDDIDENSDYDLDEGGYFHEIYFNGPSSDFTIDTGGDDLVIMVDDIYIKGNLIITGGGTLNLYVNHSANFQTPQLYNSTDGTEAGADPNDLVIHLADASTITLQAGLVFYGYIYGPGATVVEWADATMHGAVVASSFAGNGQPQIEYVEPDDDIGIGDIEAYEIENWGR